MKRFIHPILIIALGFSTMSAFAKTVSVNIQDFTFKPANVTVDLGDTVNWTNKDPAPHTTVADNGAWTSPLLNKNAVFAQTFKVAGTFTYHCSIHPSMTGKIIVRTAEATRANIGKRIVTGAQAVLPIKLNLTGKKAQQVYQGSYIVNAQSSCSDCHSCPTYQPGHNPFKGESLQYNATSYLAGGVAFGPFLSRNLTPDSNGKPAGLTLSQFKDTMRTGHSPNSPGTTLQVMPWPAFGMMSDNDLNAVYEYLRSIPSAKTPTATCN